jgi:hypothetical protein
MSVVGKARNQVCARMLVLLMCLASVHAPAGGKSRKLRTGNYEPEHLQTTPHAVLRVLCQSNLLSLLGSRGTLPACLPACLPAGAWSVGTASRRSRTYPDLACTSLWLFRDDSTLRLHLYSIVTSRWFDYLMFFFIVLNCVAMAYEYPHMSRDNLDGAILFWRWAHIRLTCADVIGSPTSSAVTCSMLVLH